MFSTLEQKPIISGTIENALYSHFRAELAKLHCPVASINGTADHIHILLLLNPLISITDLVKQIKGNTSHWVNAHNLAIDRFAWQKGFGAFSVSDKNVPEISNYIQHQKTIHLTKTFLREYDETIAAHGILTDILNEKAA